MINWTDILSAIASVIAVIVSIWAGATAWQAQKDAERVNDITAIQFAHSQHESNITWQQIEQERPDDALENYNYRFITMVGREDITNVKVEFSQHGKILDSIKYAVDKNTMQISTWYPSSMFSVYGQNIYAKITWSYESGYKGVFNLEYM